MMKSRKISNTPHVWIPFMTEHFWWAKYQTPRRCLNFGGGRAGKDNGRFGSWTKIVTFDECNYRRHFRHFWLVIRINASSAEQRAIH